MNPDILITSAGKLEAPNDDKFYNRNSRNSSIYGEDEPYNNEKIEFSSYLYTPTLYDNQSISNRSIISISTRRNSGQFSIDDIEA
jgi:hypothetical protein